MSTRSGTPLSRLSVPRVRRKPFRPLSADELDLLRRVGAVLIPASATRPGVGDLSAFEELAHEAVAIVDPELNLVAELVGSLRSLDGEQLLDELRHMSQTAQELFYPLSLIVTGMYIYSDEVIEAVGYPLPHRNAPSNEQIADELMSGVLEHVVERGSIYRSID